MAFNSKDLAGKFNEFMSRRNGPDQMSRDLFVLALVVFAVSCFVADPVAHEILSTVFVLLLVYSYFRMFSARKDDRARENDAYVAKRHALAVKLHLDKLGAAGRKAAEQAAREGQKAAERKQDKDHRYLHCPKCGQDVRVPRGAGKIRISCPKCGEKFEKKV